MSCTYLADQVDITTVRSIQQCTSMALETCQLKCVGTTHEALGVFAGRAQLKFGRSDQESDGGLLLDVQAGDVLVLPAGMLHRAMSDSDDFQMVGAYPQGAKPWDMRFAKTEKECQEAIEHIRHVPKPEKDPYTGDDIWLS